MPGGARRCPEVPNNIQPDAWRMAAHEALLKIILRSNVVISHLRPQASPCPCPPPGGNRHGAGPTVASPRGTWDAHSHRAAKRRSTSNNVAFHLPAAVRHTRATNPRVAGRNGWDIKNTSAKMIGVELGTCSAVALKNSGECFISRHAWFLLTRHA